MTHKLALLLLGLAQQLGEGGEAGHRQLLHENAHQVRQNYISFVTQTSIFYFYSLHLIT